MIFVLWIVFIISPFLRIAHFKKFRITYFQAVIQVRFAVRFPHTVLFRPATPLSKNNCSRYRAGKWAAHIGFLRRRPAAGNFLCGSYSKSCAQGSWFLPAALVWFSAPFFRLLSVFRAAKKPPGMTPTAQWLPSVYIITEIGVFLWSIATGEKKKT